MSDCSRSTSPLSDISAQDSVSTANTEFEQAIASRHFLLLSDKCTSVLELDAALRALPLRSRSNEYLVLGLNCTRGPGQSAGVPVTIQQGLEEFGKVIGNEKAFDEWFMGPTDGQGVFVSSSESDSQQCSTEIIEAQFNHQEDGALTLSYNEAFNVFASSGVHVVYDLDVLSNNSGLQKVVFLLERAPFSFPSLSPTSSPAEELIPNPFGPPTRLEWKRLWAAWDFITLEMIPPSMLHQKPIDLRHKCLFYIGHIPTFLDMLLSHLFKQPYSEPKNFTRIFERGIDPHVDDPEYCHSHSDVPEKDEDWPTLDEILSFRDRVRARLMALYDDLDAGRRRISRRIARVLQMTLEHEGFHIETLLYMLIQRAGTGTLPPPGFTRPAWSELKRRWAAVPPPASSSVIVGPSTLVLGHDDAESSDTDASLCNDVADHEFGWDNESPRREVVVRRFKIDWRPITNGEYYAYWKAQTTANKFPALPASWVQVNEDIDIFVRTVYGPVPLEIAENWPILASYDELTTFAKSKGGRIPSEPELRLFLNQYQVDFDHGANEAFRNWHPVAATAGLLSEANGKGSNGGVWEWTSTELSGHEGFDPTTIFPGYSSDFFDGKHQVVLGASYATVPRLAGRRTVRNFYQRNYPYAWVGARVAYDVD